MATTPAPLEQALFLAELGHPVLSLHGVASDRRCTCGKTDCASPAKHPYPPFSPRGAHSATTDEATIRGWFEKRPRNNYGVAAARLFIVDIDVRNGGVESWKKTNRRERAAADLARSHRLRRLACLLCASALCSVAAKLLPGIDIKTGDGAYVVGAWLQASLWRRLRMGSGLASARGAARPASRLAPRGPGRGANARARARSSFIATSPPKDCRTARATSSSRKLSAHLYHNLIEPDDALILEIFQGWNLGRGKPPLDPEEVEDVVAGVAYREYRARGLIK